MTVGENRSRIQVSTRCDREVVADARDAVVGMMRLRPDYTLAELTETGLASLNVRARTAGPVRRRPMKRGARVPFSTTCDPDVWNESAAVVNELMRTAADYSRAEHVETALAVEVERLQNEHNAGKPWPRVTTRLRRGRRIAE